MSNHRLLVFLPNLTVLAVDFIWLRLTTISDAWDRECLAGMKAVDYMIENAAGFHSSFISVHLPGVACHSFWDKAWNKCSRYEAGFHEQAGEFITCRNMNWPGTVNQWSCSHGKNQIAQKLCKNRSCACAWATGDLLKIYRKLAQVPTRVLYYARKRWQNQSLAWRSHREGLSCQKFEALIDLIDWYPEMILFCSDDKASCNLALFSYQWPRSSELVPKEKIFLMYSEQLALIRDFPHWFTSVGPLEKRSCWF